jgi:hypothetical protein
MRFTAALTVAAMAGAASAMEHPKNGTAPAYVTEGELPTAKEQSRTCTDLR